MDRIGDPDCEAHPPGKAPSSVDLSLTCRGRSLAIAGAVLWGWLRISNWTCSMLLDLIISSFVDKPYGVSPTQVSFLVLRGPSRPAIPDYEDPRRAKGKGR
jgi:hypothetical protein